MTKLDRMIEKHKRGFLRRRKMLLNKFLPSFYNVIRNQYKAFIDAVDEHGYGYAKNNMNDIVSSDELFKLLKEYYLQAAFLESNTTLKNIGTNYKYAGFKISLDDLVPVLDEYFKIYQFKKSAFPITQTTKLDLIKKLVDKVDGGDDLKTALKALKDIAIDGKYNLSYRRAKLIAKTELTKAMNFGSIIGAYMSGKDLEKVWVTVHDERVRPTADYPSPFSHRKLDKEKSDLMNPFFNGEYIKYPGDPDADPKNTINCRCSLIYVEKDQPKNFDEGGDYDNGGNGNTLIGQIPTPSVKPFVTRNLANFIIDFFVTFILTTVITKQTNDAIQN